MKSERVYIVCKVKLFLDQTRFWNSQSGDADFSRVDSSSSFRRIFSPHESIHETRVVAFQWNYV